MKAFIANFGVGNYLWPSCRDHSTLAIFEEEDTWLFWQAGDREGYIERCISAKKTAAGITPTRPVASRWFNLPGIISSTQNDLWIHRERTELWWTISRAGEMEVSLEPAPDQSKRVYVLRKKTAPWSNIKKDGQRLLWGNLHPKARTFLFAEGTLQQLSSENAAYAYALIEGTDLTPWHSLASWREKAKNVEIGTVFNARERAVIDMAATARATAASSNGQLVMRTVKKQGSEIWAARI